MILLWKQLKNLAWKPAKRGIKIRQTSNGVSDKINNNIDPSKWSIKKTLLALLMMTDLICYRGKGKFTSFLLNQGLTRTTM